MEAVATIDVARDDLTRRARWTLLMTLAVFYAALAWCVAYHHGVTPRTDGISYYGVNHRTIAACAVGYGIGALGLSTVAGMMRRLGGPRVTWLGLRLVALMLVLLFATPYDKGSLFYWTHVAVGVTGALVQVAMAYTLCRRRPDVRSIAPFSVLLLGGVLGAFSLPHWSFQILLYGEILIELGFSWSLIEWLREIQVSA